MNVTTSAKSKCFRHAYRTLLLFGAMFLTYISMWPASAQDVPFVPVAPDHTGSARLEIQNGQLVLPPLTNNIYSFTTEEEINNLDVLLSYADESGTFADIGDMRFYLPDIQKYRDALASQLQSRNSKVSNESNAKANGGIAPQSATGFEYQRRDKWANGIVYYRFGSGVAGTGSTEQNHQRQFLAACREWEEVADIKFKEGDNGSSQPSYIRVEDSFEDRANIGMIGGPNGANITFHINSWNDKFVIVHELGHTLGLIHEHQRPDRDTYITVHTDKIRSDSQIKQRCFCKLFRWAYPLRFSTL